MAENNMANQLPDLDDLDFSKYIEKNEVTPEELQGVKEMITPQEMKEVSYAIYAKIKEIQTKSEFEKASTENEEESFADFDDEPDLKPEIMEKVPELSLILDKLDEFKGKDLIPIFREYKDKLDELGGENIKKVFMHISTNYGYDSGALIFLMVKAKKKLNKDLIDDIIETANLEEQETSLFAKQNLMRSQQLAGSAIVDEAINNNRVSEDAEEKFKTFFEQELEHIKENRLDYETLSDEQKKKRKEKIEKLLSKRLKELIEGNDLNLKVLISHRMKYYEKIQAELERVRKLLNKKLPFDYQEETF